MSDRGIFMPEDAERFYKKNAGKSYRPSNGTEGDYFHDSYCGDCRLFRPEGGEPCKIAKAAFWNEIGALGYPKEWIYGPDGQPTCTAFEEIKS